MPSLTVLARSLPRPPDGVDDEEGFVSHGTGVSQEIPTTFSTTETVCNLSPPRAPALGRNAGVMDTPPGRQAGAVKVRGGGAGPAPAPGLAAVGEGDLQPLAHSPGMSLEFEIEIFLGTWATDVVLPRPTAGSGWRGASEPSRVLESVLDGSTTTERGYGRCGWCGCSDGCSDLNEGMIGCLQSAVSGPPGRWDGHTWCDRGSPVRATHPHRHADRGVLPDTLQARVSGPGSPKTAGFTCCCKPRCENPRLSGWCAHRLPPANIATTSLASMLFRCWPPKRSGLPTLCHARREEATIVLKQDHRFL